MFNIKSTSVSTGGGQCVSILLKFNMSNEMELAGTKGSVG